MDSDRGGGDGEVTSEGLLQNNKYIFKNYVFELDHFRSRFRSIPLKRESDSGNYY